MSSSPVLTAESLPRPQANKTQLVYEHVMARIVDGSLPAGASLSIAGLSAEMGVSLIPTREALRRLESEGLVEFLYHRGVRVAELGINGYREVMQTQAVLEALAVRLSAPLLDTEALQLAREANQLMDAAIQSKDLRSYSEHSILFHSLLRAPCPNQHLKDMLDRGESRVAAVRASVVGYRGALAQQLSREHLHMVDRIAAGAPPAEIEQLMRAHREGTIAADSETLRQRHSDQRAAAADAVSPSSPTSTSSWEQA